MNFIEARDVGVLVIGFSMAFACLQVRSDQGKVASPAQEHKKISCSELEIVDLKGNVVARLASVDATLKPEIRSGGPIPRGGYVEFFGADGKMVASMGPGRVSQSKEQTGYLMIAGTKGANAILRGYRQGIALRFDDGKFGRSIRMGVDSVESSIVIDGGPADKGVKSASISVTANGDLEIQSKSGDIKFKSSSN